MEPMIRIPLLSDIGAYCVFIPMLAYGTGKVSVCPKFSTPKLLLYLGAPLEYLPCRNTLDDRYCSAYAVRWDALHEKMHMIVICANFQEFHLITLLNLYAHLLHHFIYILIKYCPSVLCGKHQMIDKHRNGMALMNIFAHLHIVRRKRRGIQPEVIQSPVRKVR